MSVLEDNGAMKPHETAAKPDLSVPPHKNRERRAATFGVLAIVVLALGAAAGAGAMKLTRPSLELAPMTPVAISAMTDSSLVTVKGKVTEVFGNKFIVQDDSGRALVETGPSGINAKTVTADETVSVQGRFEDGFLHASYIVRQDGSIEALGPAVGPPHRRGPLEEMLPHVTP
ncbi:hypothetical protein [Shinella sp. NM-101]|uniref:hypothetical protein n=1 Tax=Shinella sp. NM-101 TaxID=2744455 RepID=UPI00351CB9F8